MDRIDIFLQEMYEDAPQNRVLVSTIYEAFGEWITTNFGPAEWNTYEKRQFFKDLKANGRYLYNRYYNGINLVGLKRRGTELRSSGTAAQPSSSSRIPRRRLVDHLRHLSNPN